MSSKNIQTRSKKQKAQALTRSNRLHEARKLYEQICRTDPRDAEAWCALGAIHGMLEDFDASIICCQRAVAIRPDFPEALCNLGAALDAKGRFEEAAESCQRALQMLPAYGDAHYNLGNALKSLGRLNEAIESYRRALRSMPNDPETHVNLAISLNKLGHPRDAIAHLERALRHRPNYPEAYNSFGNALDLLGNQDDAIKMYRNALVLKPGHVNALNNMAISLASQGRLEEAVRCYQEALALKPDFAAAHNNLGLALQAQGRLDEAIASYRQALKTDPHYTKAYSNLLFTMNYAPDIDASTLYAEHVRWAETQASAAPGAPPRSNPPEPARRLKVGYLSPDFRAHSVAFFIEAILTHHDRASIETYCYAEVASPDETTKRLMEKAGCWRRTCGLTDAQVADTIRADAIDILVDLAGHTANNRLMVCARRPAPVQISYLGYPNTTGLATIDHRLTDALADPPGQEAFYAEKLTRLARGFLCYTPPAHAPSVGPLPARQAGHVTFVSFNVLAKVNQNVVALWAKILDKLPGARVLLKNKSLRDAATRERYLSLFREHGIDGDRVELVGWLEASTDHLALYNRADIALDTFPYNGTTTTCEALWMGVPAITLAGDRHAGRVGTSLLTQVGLPEMIANTAEEYVKIAVELAADLDRLAALRSGLRERVANSPLCDGITFTRRLEQAYRGMWERWRAAITTETGLR